MVKLRNKKRLKWALNQHEHSRKCVRDLASLCGVTPRRFRQVYADYRVAGEVPLIGQNVGRPRRAVPQEHRKAILAVYERYRLNALYLEKVIYAQQGIRIPHNAIHHVLLEEGLAVREPNKSRRRKPWVRYEREHSLSAGHMDWHIPAEGPNVCVVLDDASRKILSGGEFEEATAEHSKALVQEVLDTYGQIRMLRETITDHGTQFYANTRDKRGKAAHAFELFLAERGIRHILCRYNHPQSNGKVEKWFDLYKRHRHRFPTFQEFIAWYNDRPHGSLNLRRAETPEMAFWRKMPQTYYFGIAVNCLGW